MIDVYNCKHYSPMAAMKDGKACIADPDCTVKCMPWLYEDSDCPNYEEYNLKKILEETE